MVWDRAIALGEGVFLLYCVFFQQVWGMRIIRAAMSGCTGCVLHKGAWFRVGLTFDIYPSQVMLVVKNPPAKGDMGSIPGSGRSSGEGNGNLLLYSCLGNSMGRGAWQATVHGAPKDWTRLSTYILKKRCILFFTTSAELSAQGPWPPRRCIVLICTKALWLSSGPRIVQIHISFSAVFKSTKSWKSKDFLIDLQQAHLAAKPDLN